MSKNHEKPVVKFCWWCGRKLWGRHHSIVKVDGLPRTMHHSCVDALPYKKIHVLKKVDHYPGFEHTGEYEFETT
jgi:hypothetical protein